MQPVRRAGAGHLEEIAGFCARQDISFPLAEKIAVNGPTATRSTPP
ncbi:hypothetical protein QMZ92_17640 [Streptomyces sp. HNM0645]|nr:hypothetical protein [Streptomyces sp. HNM0645]MDI9886153.1 hypothetical protein [Streptomyces sp. HNM0645]